jgi:Flp pilus assembly protein TadG
MRNTTQIYRWSSNQIAPRSGSRASRRTGIPSIRGKTRGQSMLIIALASVALIGLVGLAIDGGSMYGQRRNAQNATDGAALAATRLMLTQYEAMILANLVDVDGTAAQEQDLKNTITSYAAAHGLIASSVKAYFVNNNRQIVSVIANGNLGNPCGTAPGLSPCQVGQNMAIPWTIGARAINVTGRSQTGAFFMKFLGFNDVGATATATALMGVGVTTSNISAMPFGLFTTTLDIDNMVPGQLYVLIDSNVSQGPGNSGWVDWNAQSSSANATNALIDCGYNPSVHDQAEWDVWCPSHAGQGNVFGPTTYWTGWPSITAGPLTDYYVQYGPGELGWWIQASTGVTIRNCEDLATRVNGGNGEVFIIPIFDTWTGSGTGTYYHLRTLARFRLHNSAIDCHEHSPLPGGGQTQHWHIEGYYVQRYSADTSGQAGDLRQNSNHIIFLAP